MALKSLFEMPTVTLENFEEVMNSAILLELSTIPTYLSTYYSIHRAPDQDEMCTKISAMLPEGVDATATAQELTLDLLTFADQAAGFIMSVLMEEMLHLSLSSNVKSAIFGTTDNPSPPPLMKLGKKLKFPTHLPGHIPAFDINLDKLSTEQLIVLLKIESPNAFSGKGESPTYDKDGVTYHTIGQFYDEIIAALKKLPPDTWDSVGPQLLPSEKQIYYSQNSINTVYYDRAHAPQFPSADDSGGLIEVKDVDSATRAMNEIIKQGEGAKVDKKQLKFGPGPDHLPIPWKVHPNGKVSTKWYEYDDSQGKQKGKELSHFSKFMEIYSVGHYYERKFAGYGIHFYDLFVYNQAKNPKLKDYEASGNKALIKAAQLGNAYYTYLLLLVETVYTKDYNTQFKVFLFGIHKLMMWLLSGMGNAINKYEYKGPDDKKYQGALTFEVYPFDKDDKEPHVQPKEQMIRLANELAALDSYWDWLLQHKYRNYLMDLPEVDLQGNVTPNVPEVPATDGPSN